MRGAMVMVYSSCEYATRASHTGLPVPASSASNRPSMMGAMIMF